jgi:ketosteroid isomerase-like protein
MTDANDPIAVAERFMDALNRADADGVRAAYAPDARIWHNFDLRLQSVEDNIETMQFVHSKLQGLNYDVQKRIAYPDGFVQQHILRGTLASGEAFALPACAICTVKNGQITLLEEYLDTAQARPLFR